MDTHSTLLAWEIPETEAAGRLQSTGPQSRRGTRLTRTLPTRSPQRGHPEAHSFPMVGEAASHTQMPPRESVLYHNFLVISLLFSILPY